MALAVLRLAGERRRPPLGAADAGPEPDPGLVEPIYALPPVPLRGGQPAPGFRSLAGTPQVAKADRRDLTRETRLRRASLRVIARL